MPGSEEARLGARLHVRSQDVLLLRAALADDDSFDGAFDTWAAAVSDRPDHRAYNLLQMLAPRLSHRDETPLIRLCRNQYRLCWAKRKVQERSLGRVLPHLVAAGIPLFVFKGPTLASFYADPGARAPGDLDVMVPERCFRDATHALLDAGATNREFRHVRYFDPRFGHALNFETQERELVDLHIHPLHDTFTWKAAAPMFWAAGEACNVAGIDVLSPSPHHHLLLVAEHRFSDPRATSRWVADAAMLVRSGKVDWQNLESDAQALGLARVVGGVLTVLGDLGVSTPPGVADRLRGTAQPIRWPVDFNGPLPQRIRKDLSLIWRMSGRSPTRLAAGAASTAKMWLAWRGGPVRKVLADWLLDAPDA